MRRLFHFELCPFSRKVRLALHEKGLAFRSVDEPFWLKRPEFLSLNPLGAVPVLKEDNGVVISDSVAIVEFLEESAPDAVSLMPDDVYVRAEVRRLSAWFDGAFFSEISAPLIAHRVLKRIWRRDKPDAVRVDRVFALSKGPSEVLRSSSRALRFHLDYLGWLLERRDWLGLRSVSSADLSVAAHLSVVDYLGVMPWKDYPGVKRWYARIKSRPSFRFVLADRVDCVAPPSYYGDPDF